MLYPHIYSPLQWSHVLCIQDGQPDGTLLSFRVTVKRSRRICKGMAVFQGQDLGENSNLLETAAKLGICRVLPATPVVPRIFLHRTWSYLAERVSWQYQQTGELITLYWYFYHCTRWDRVEACFNEKHEKCENIWKVWARLAGMMKHCAKHKRMRLFRGRKIVIWCTFCVINFNSTF